MVSNAMQGGSVHGHHVLGDMVHFFDVRRHQQDLLAGADARNHRSTTNNLLKHTSPNELTVLIGTTRGTQHFANGTSLRAAVMTMTSGATQASGHNGVNFSMIATGPKHNTNLSLHRGDTEVFATAQSLSIT